uniref:CCHC-type domain-containing protein n=1 Tax=Tanacetum cinerariifolium TaxID=118510 RepID=A0A6L2M8K1_TANCI|nr:hypothetical protein [Tanacetum cinerariifolium]
MVSFVKLHILKKGEYILWTMKMEQYPAHTDYALWEVILNGNGKVQMTKDEAGNEVEVPPVTAHQILERIRERKAKSTLLMAIPDEHLARFNGIKDATTLWAVIKSIFGEGLDKGYDRFRRLLSLLEIHRAGVSTEDANQKFLRSLPSAWSNISLIMRNKPGIDNLDIDDLTSSTNELKAAYSVSTATGHSSQAQGSSSYDDELMFSYFANQSSSPQLYNKDLEQIDQDDLEEMDLKWQVECFNCHKRGHFSRDCRTAKNPRYKGRDNGKRPAKEEDEKALVVQDGLGTYDWSYQLKKEATDFALMAFTSNLSSLNSKGTGHRESRLVWNNVQRINHQNKFAPIAVFTRFGRIPVSTVKPKAAASTSAAKPVNTCYDSTSISLTLPRSYLNRNKEEEDEILE